MQSITRPETEDRSGAKSEYADSQRLKNERSQQIIRILFFIVVGPWAAYMRFSDGLAGGLAFVLGVSLFYLAVILAAYADINNNPQRSARLPLCVFVDILVIGVATWLTYVPSSPAFFVFLFIIASNTMRYGRGMMMFTLLLSLAAYSANLVAYVFFDMSPVHGIISWPLEAGKILSLIIIPLLMGSLLKQAEDRRKCVKTITDGLRGYTIGQQALSFNLERNDDLQVLAEHIELLTHEVKRQQDQLSNQALNLQKVVAERTAELNTQVTKAQESDRLKTQFLNNLSHELRTPLHNIIGFSELLDKPDLDREKAGKMLRIIGQRAKELLEKLETLTRLTCLMAGEEYLEMSPLNIRELAESITGRFMEKAGRKSIKLGLGIDVERPMVIADYKIIDQILSKLIDNAIKFTPAGGEVKIDISQTGQRLDIIVSDNGVGIAEDDQRPIFDLFRQMDGGLNRRFEGLGIGLFIVKLLVNLHNGEIQMKSKEGEGSSFIVSIPVSRIG